MKDKKLLSVIFQKGSKDGYVIVCITSIEHLIFITKTM